MADNKKETHTISNEAPPSTLLNEGEGSLIGNIIPDSLKTSTDPDAQTRELQRVIKSVKPEEKLAVALSLEASILLEALKIKVEGMKEDLEVIMNHKWREW